MLLKKIPEWPGYDLRSPFEELDRIKQEMGRLTGGLGARLFSQPLAGVFPSINITEDNDCFVVRAELPGIMADEIDISVTHDTLSISGEKKIPSESEDARYHRREREANSAVSST